MVYQNFGLPAVAGGATTDGYAAKVKENKRQEKLAKKAAKNAEKAAKSEASRKKAQRKVEARAILDNNGYNDIALANRKQAPGCTGPGCRPQPAVRPRTYSEQVAIQNRNIKQQERAMQMARAQAPARAPVKTPTVAPVKAPAGYGYYKDGNRQMPVPTTKDGFVRQDYLRGVQNGRSPASIARDADGVSARVYPARVTPRQAGPWIKNPGYADIPGIDAPRGTPPTVYNKNIGFGRSKPAPVAVQQPAPYRGPAQAPTRYGNRNVAPEPAYTTVDVLLPVKKGVTGVRMKDSEGRPFIIPQNPSGTVPKSYLHNINDARPASARALDEKNTSKLVIPASPTPYQAYPWVVNPGRYDVPGVDAPAGTPPTYVKYRTEEAANKARARASTKYAETKPRDQHGLFITLEEAKELGIINAPKQKKTSSSKGKGKSSGTKSAAKLPPSIDTEGTKASVKRDPAPTRAGGRDGQTSMVTANSNRKPAVKKQSASKAAPKTPAKKPSTASAKKSCGTKKPAQTKKR